LIHRVIVSITTTNNVIRGVARCSVERGK